MRTVLTTALLVQSMAGGFCAALSADEIVHRIVNDPAIPMPTGPKLKNERWYVYDWFDVPPTEGTNAMPLAIAMDPRGMVWINPEFHLKFAVLPGASDEVKLLEFPRPPNPGVFATTIFGDHRTQISMCGEDVIVDPRGRIWFSQGGGYLYGGEHPNHSRLLCYEPDAPEDTRWRVFNVPGDHNEIIGLAWDETRGLIWFANGGLDASGIWRRSLACFDPDSMPHDGFFDFSTSIDDRVCESPLRGDSALHLVPPGKFRVYPLPQNSHQPAHLALDADGNVWYTAFWGNAIGRLDPSTGIVREIPLSKARAKSGPAAVVGAGPWQILINDAGDVVFNEFFDSQVCRLPVSAIDDPRALALNDDGRNTFVEEMSLPDADLELEMIHSIAEDPAGNVWFTVHNSADNARGFQVGYVHSDWSGVSLIPSFSNFPGVGHPTADGIAIDQKSGDVFMAEFFRKRIGRLRPVAELPVTPRNLEIEPPQ